MNFIRRFFILLVIALLALNGYCNKNANGELRVKYNFNAQWLLNVGDDSLARERLYNDELWKSITLPYAWNQEEAFKFDIHHLTTGIAWYRKCFKLPKNDKGKKVFIEFEGVRQGADFYVNGKFIGHHDNGVMAVGFDITDYLYFGKKDNIIAVRTDNNWKYREKSSGSTFQWNNDNFNANYGGIPKNVYLHVVPEIYQTLPLFSNLKTIGTYVYASNIDINNKSILLNAEAQVKNETDKKQNIKLKVDLLDLSGRVIASFMGANSVIEPDATTVLKANSNVNNIEFWSWGYGYLYDVKTSILVNDKPVDALITRTGFRKTDFKDGMFYLNDRVLQLKGYAQRTSNEWPAIGMSCPPWMSDFSNRMMVENNGNLVRWMHVTPWKQDVESCDRVGLIQAMPAGDAEKDVKGRRWEQRCELMRDAIIYNRNNPSIIFYEGGNESISEEHMAELKAIRDLYDPYGGRAIGSREMLDSKVAEYGGEMLYINKSANIPMWAMEYSRDEGLRKYWDDYSYPYHKNGTGGTFGHNVNGSKIKDASSYNHNQDSHAIENIRRWFDYWEMRPGTGRRVSSGGVNIIFSDTNTHYRGAENYRRSGEVDAMRIPKDNLWVHKVMWDGWVDIEKDNTKIFGHWNYADTICKPVYVVSNSNKVELFVNDKSKGFGKQSFQFLHTFDSVVWESGIIKAVAYDNNDSIISSDIIKTAGEPYAIRLTPILNPSGMKADGADIALIDVEVVDKNGQRCPLANNMVKFDLFGEAIWLGGIAQGLDNYILANPLPVECGINRVMIRSTTKAGNFKIKASSDGLNADEVIIKTNAVVIENGLTKKMASEGLDVYLDRGPTPVKPSFKTSRITIPIVDAVAGVNNNKAKNSFDDNELTEWTNDGLISTGWVTYTLAEESEIDQCIIKLTGWRMRQYPIKITVDGKTVFNDTTIRSLGYVTLPLKRTKGSKVTIQLMGANSESDGYGQIVEITGNKELDLYRDPNAMKSEGQLRIVEVEFCKLIE
ncbi:MAG: DUF4982 domain-containing protein [Marinilabiliaceae bacterium]|nr:DUF4982 domain-containing protein [Marinilabiliaceae bacterium]